MEEMVKRPETGPQDVHIIHPTLKPHLVDGWDG